jgi:hypothetical protein
VKYFAVGLLCVLACTGSLGGDVRQRLLDVPVESWKTVDAASLNEQIEAASLAGAEWPESPAMAALTLVGGDVGSYALSLREQANRVEGPDTVVVEIACDGFADDSVRGNWHRIVLVLGPDGRTWRVAEMRRAYRCQRGHNTDAYGADLCP